MATRAGTLLGRYQIKAMIGQGAMGVVYCARDPKINRTVAIKTVSLAGLEADAEREYRERFVLEAQAAGRLSHPGIITVFDVAEEQETGTPYLVMEYVEGKSLGQLLSGEQGGLPLRTALHVAQEVAEALQYAHAQGVVHRDIKPANILITADGHAKIADFGIAKLNQTHLTQHGRVLGSPAYMAPEQLNDEGVDARSDLFSLGVVLYFMLTGQRPFQGNSIATVCFKLAHHEPLAVATYDMSFPPELDLVVSRAIAKNPAQRYQSGAEMARDIQRLRESCGFIQTSNLRQDQIPHAMSAALSRPASSRPWIFVIALFVFALLSAIYLRTHKVGQIGPPPDAFVVSQPGGSLVAPPLPANAELHLEIEHPFTVARASVWLDNQLVYTQLLRADPKNPLLVFRKRQGHDSHKIELQPGKHLVRVRVQSPATTYDQSKTLALTLPPRGGRTLRVNCDRKHNLLQLTLQ